MSQKEIEIKLHNAVDFLKQPSKGKLQFSGVIDMTWIPDDEPEPPVPPEPPVLPDQDPLPSNIVAIVSKYGWNRFEIQGMQGASVVIKNDNDYTVLHATIDTLVDGHYEYGGSIYNVPIPPSEEVYAGDTIYITVSINGYKDWTGSVVVTDS